MQQIWIARSSRPLVYSINISAPLWISLNRSIMQSHLFNQSFIEFQLNPNIQWPTDCVNNLRIGVPILNRNGSDSLSRPSHTSTWFRMLSAKSWSDGSGRSIRLPFFGCAWGGELNNFSSSWDIWCWIRPNTVSWSWWQRKEMVEEVINIFWLKVLLDFQSYKFSEDGLSYEWRS